MPNISELRNVPQIRGTAGSRGVGDMYGYVGI